MKHKSVFLQIFFVVAIILFLLGYFVDLQAFLTEHPLSYSLFPFAFVLILGLIIILTAILIFRFYVRINLDKNIITTCLKISLVVFAFLIVSCLQIVFELEKSFYLFSPLCVTISICALRLILKDRNKDKQ